MLLMNVDSFIGEKPTEREPQFQHQHSEEALPDALSNSTVRTTSLMREREAPSR